MYVVNEKSTVKEILINKFGISSRLLRKLKLNKRIFCNKKEAWVNDETEVGDVIEVDITFEESDDKTIPEKFDLDVLYEDSCLLVINKPAGVVVHPTCIHPEGTLANFVKAYLTEKGENVTMRFVNRLDRETSGIVIFAKNEFTQEALTRQMQNGKFEKRYVAIVHGKVLNDSGTVDFPIKRESGSIMTRTVASDGKYAVTHYSVIKRLDNDMTVLKLELETGRTHQIRVHMKAIGHPILGDGLYSDIETGLISRQALHSEEVVFFHPITGERLKINAKLPKDMAQILGENI